MTDPRELREHRDEVLSRLAEGPIHTRYHQVNEALVERQERLRTEGNRKARRRAAAMARKGRPVVMPPTFYPVDPDRLNVVRGHEADLPAVGSFHG